MNLHVIFLSVFSSRGDSAVRQCGQLTALMWLDNRVVSFLATNVQPTEMSMVHRKRKDGSTREVQCPAAVKLYNTYMGGVDYGDQLRGYYHVRLKNRKYYKYIFWFLFDVSITNSFILFREAHPAVHQAKHVINFRLELARSLIGEYNSRKYSSINHPNTIHTGHFPLKKIYDQGQSQRPRGRCYYCWNINKPQVRRDTPWYCTECNHFFCHTGKTETDCFYIYHSSTQFITQ